MKPSRIPNIKQRDQTDCGAACLHAAAVAYGVRVPVARIRQFASTDKRGTNVLGLVEAAKRLGFTAKGVRGTRDSLSKIPTPAIAHIHRGTMAHYVVVARVRGTRIDVMDPEDGRPRRMTLDEFCAEWTGVLIIMVPSADLRPTSGSISPVARFWALVAPHRVVLGQAVVGAALYTILGLSTAVYVQKLLDNVLVDGNRNLLNLMSAAMIVLLLAQTFVGAMKSIIVMRTGQSVDARLVLGYYNHLLRLPQTFFDTMRVGEITSRVGDAVKIRAFINDVAVDLSVNVLVIVFAFAALFVYNARLAALMALLVPSFALLYAVANTVNRRMQRKLMERGADVQAQLVESLTAIGTVKRLGLEPHAAERTESRFVELLRSAYDSGIANLSAGVAAGFLARLFAVILLWVGAGFVLDRSLTPGALMSCYALLGYLTGPIASLVGVNKTLQEALIAADRLFEIIDLESEETTGGMDLQAANSGDIRFESIGFRYGSRRQVFSNLDLVIPRGSITAVIGESGCGKSTLAALLQRLYPVESGRILLGDVDIKYASLDSLRRMVGTVPQRIELFAGTVLENLAPGEIAPDMARVLGLVRSLGIDEFVERLPGGLHAHLGENGGGLSGGERQRLAIARAMYRCPSILVLDEATSSLDTRSEQMVRRALSEYRDGGTTVIVIAHRLSSIAGADAIVVLDAGRVVEQGSHNCLLDRGGVYAELWRRQYSPATAFGFVPALSVAHGGQLAAN